ncbi:putative ribonuclease H-like domain-containing protein [Tanacetum coccineum]
MDIETAQTNITAKLPLLKQGEYEMWKLRIEQYFQVQDYALWDVIENGNSFKPVARTTTNAEGTSTTQVPGPVTTEEKAQKKNDVKARSMLLMALPNEHLLTFNQYKDAKTLFAAIHARFGGNDATKKTQKTLLKQMYENFIISQEDLNLKFLRSLPSEWNTHIVIWRNKPDLDTMSFDDLYNNFKIVEQEVRGTANSSSSLISTASTQVSTANLSDATVYAFLANQTNGSQLVHEDLEQIHEDDLEEMDLKWQLALLSMRTRRFFQKTGRKITINRSNTAGYDKSKNQNSSRRTVNMKEISSKAMLAIHRACFDWSYMADDAVPTNMALMAFSDSEFNKFEFNLATYKRGLAFVEEQLVFYKKNEVMFYEQIAVLKRDISYKDSKISELKRSQIPDKSRKGLGFVSYNVVPPPHTGLFSPPNIDLSNSGLEEFQHPEFEGYGPKTSKNVSEDIPNEVNCNYHLRERVVSGNNYTRVNYNYSTQKSHPSAHRNIVPRAVLMKNGIRTLNTARPVNTAHPKTTVYNARPMSYFSKSAQSTVKRPYYKRTTLTNKYFNQKVNTAKGKVNTARPKVVNTARPNTTVINAVRANQGHPQKEDQGYVDSGCSRHMTGNMSYLSDFKEFDGGYVTFGEEPKEVELLMCDKKNSVLFADTGCFVLSPDFKLADESQVLLKVSRKNNMYNVDMKNIVPKESLTCLVTKATLDESMLWHMRLGKATQSLLFTWVFFLTTKDETIGILKKFITEIENLVDKKVKIIRCDNRTEFKNSVMNDFCAMKADSKLPTTFWAKTVNTACYVQNRILVVKPHNKTPYELLRGKFDGKFDDGFFVGYSLNTKAFRVYNIRTKKVEENLHVRFLEDKPIIADGLLFDYSLKDASNDEPQPSNDAEKKDDKGGIYNQERPEKNAQDVNTVGPSINTTSINFNTGSLNINTVSPTVSTAPPETSHADLFRDETKLDMSNISTTYPVPSTPNTRIHKDHSLENVIGDVQSGVKTRRMINEQGFISTAYKEKTHEEFHTFLFACFLSLEEPKKRAIGTKWVYRNKKDKRGIKIRNKARLVTQGYTQEEGIDYDEVFAPAVRIEAIRLFLAYASFKDFVVYQMDVKSAFLYGKIEDEVYVCQPLGFKDPEFPDKVYKVEKALYGLHQAPRAWYETLSTYLLTNGFHKGLQERRCVLFQMSSMGELIFFLGLQVTQKDDGIFISQDKYVDEILKKFGFTTVKTASTPMETSKPLLKDAEAEDIMFVVCACARFQVTPKAYTDSDYAGPSLDRKSTTRDENVIKEWEDRMERAATTASSLEAEHDSGNINRTQSIATLNESLLRESNSVNAVRLNLLLLAVLVYAARHTLTAVRHKLMLPGITYYCWFWTSAKAKTVNGERQIQALVDKKKVIISEMSIRSDLKLDNAEHGTAGGTDCLPTTTIFEELARMGYEKPSQKLTFYKAFFSAQWKFLIHTITQCLSAKSTTWNEFSSTMNSLIICLVCYNQQLGDMSHHKKIYVNTSHTKKIFANMKREGKDFSRRITPLFETMMVQPTQDEGETQQDDSVPTPSNDPPLNGEDSMQLSKLMLLCTNLQKQVLDLKKAKDAQAKEIADLKKRVQKLERKNKSRTTGLQRLIKVGESRRIESSKDKDSLGDHEDVSKHGRSIEDIDKDADVSLVDDTQWRSNNEEMFDINDLHGDEINVDMPVGEKQEQSAKEREVNTSVKGSDAPTTIEEITFAQTLIQIKAAKPKVITTASTTTTTTRPKARGVVVQEPSEFRTP